MILCDLCVGRAAVLDCMNSDNINQAECFQELTQILNINTERDQNQD